MESALQWNPRQQFHEQFFIRRIALQYSYLYSDKQSKGYQSRYVLDHLTHQISLQVSHVIYKDLGIDYTFTFKKRKGEYTSFADNPAGSPRTYPAYTLIDLKLYYEWKNIHFFVEISNLLNRRYFDFGDLEQSGIWFRGGIKCHAGRPSTSFL
jgi:iron complex outermembrane receptor protein